MTADIEFRELPAGSAGRRLPCDKACGNLATWEAIPTTELAKQFMGRLLLCDDDKLELEETSP